MLKYVPQCLGMFEVPLTPASEVAMRPMMLVPTAPEAPARIKSLLRYPLYTLH